MAKCEHCKNEISLEGRHPDFTPPRWCGQRCRAGFYKGLYESFYDKEAKLSRELAILKGLNMIWNSQCYYLYTTLQVVGGILATGITGLVSLIICFGIKHFWGLL